MGFKIISILILLLGFVALSGCGKSSDNAKVTGTATYLQRIALPPDAVMATRIEDVSKADAPAEVIGEQVIQTEGKQVPIPFEVSYDPNQIQENHSYSLRVRIEDGAGKLLFINDTSVPVITRGNPTSDIEIILIQTSG
jgi:putative lipoprotein